MLLLNVGVDILKLTTLNFNTSYVVIKLDFIGGFFNLLGFQYILCCY